MWNVNKFCGEEEEEATAELLALSWVLCSLFLPSRLCGSILVKWLLLVNTLLFFCKIDSRGVALIMPVARKDRTSRNARNGRICALDKKPSLLAFAYYAAASTFKRPFQQSSSAFSSHIMPSLETQTDLKGQRKS